MNVDIPDEFTTYEAVIVSEPVDRAKHVRFDVAVLTGPLKGHSVRAYLQKDSVTNRHDLLRVGTGLVASSRFKQPKNYADSNFDYVRYLKIDDRVATTYIYDSQWCSDTVCLSSLSKIERTQISALRFRHDLLKRFRDTGLDGDAYALATAMTFGDRTELSQELEDTYSVSGVVHILSLSGLHLSIIYALLCFLSLGKRRRVLRELLLLVAIWAYVLIAGAEPPLVRSALMITIYSIVSVSGRNPLSLNVLAFTALIMLTINPLSLFDIGFQLSFLAIGSIMLLHAPIANMLKDTIVFRYTPLKWMWHTIVMSSVAQLGTAPLVAFYFGRLPVYYLIGNLLAIPLTTLILYMSVALLAVSFLPVFGGLTSILGELLATVLTWFVSALNVSMSAIAALPHASIDGITLNSSQVFWVYFTIISTILLVRKLYKLMFPPTYKLD